MFIYCYLYLHSHVVLVIYATFIMTSIMTFVRHDVHLDLLSFIRNTAALRPRYTKGFAEGLAEYGAKGFANDFREYCAEGFAEDKLELYIPRYIHI